MTGLATDGKAERFAVAQIEQMVHQFYARVREDDLIGPVFDKRIENWGPHLARMVLFWSAVLRSDRAFTMSPRGGPPALHQAIDELSAQHFERWLSLFTEVVDEVYEPSAAHDVKQAAKRIAVGLSRHLSPPYSPTTADRSHE